MSRVATYVSIGGMVTSDVGPMSLMSALAAAEFYRIEAEHCRGAGGDKMAKTCADRAEAILKAAQAASAWRRAGGWSDPNDADIDVKFRNQEAWLFAGI